MAFGALRYAWRAAEPDVYDSASRPAAALEELIELVRYRDLVGQLVRRDIVTRYKRSALGIAWTMLNPLGMMLVLTVAFSQVFQATHAYGAYLLIGIVAWTFFSQTTVAAMRNMVWGGSLIQRIYIPKTVFAVSAIGTGLVNLLLSMVPLAIVIVATGLPLRPTVLLLPMAFILLACFALGVGLLLSTMAAYFPDVAEMYEIALQAWFYLTPIIYPEDIIPEPLRFWLFNLNPMYYFVRLFRQALYYDVWPAPERLAIAVAVALVALVIGWVAFTRKADEFAYRI
jgi:ABC-2 type transport system permease protein